MAETGNVFLHRLQPGVQFFPRKMTFTSNRFCRFALSLKIMRQNIHPLWWGGDIWQYGGSLEVNDTCELAKNRPKFNGQEKISI